MPRRVGRRQDHDLVLADDELRLDLDAEVARLSSFCSSYLAIAPRHRHAVVVDLRRARILLPVLDEARPRHVSTLAKSPVERLDVASWSTTASGMTIASHPPPLVAVSIDMTVRVPMRMSTTSVRR